VPVCIRELPISCYFCIAITLQSFAWEEISVCVCIIEISIFKRHPNQEGFCIRLCSYERGFCIREVSVLVGEASV
jgi:hypothetical protein